MALNELQNLTNIQNIKEPINKIFLDRNYKKNDGNYILIEVNEDFLKNLESGKQCYIRGKNEDNAVLCTERESYSLKLNETSNSLLLVQSNITTDVPELNKVENSKILQAFSSYYEISLSRPSLGSIINRLNQYPYKGPDLEKDYDVNSFSNLADLKEIGQCSDCEIVSCLNSINAIFIDNCWRLLDEIYFYRCVIQIINIIDAKLWDFSKVSIIETCCSLSQLFPDFIVKHCMKSCVVFSEDRDCVEFAESKVCQIAASYILFKVNTMLLPDFYETWQQLLPIGMKVNSEYLKGIAIEDKILNVVKYFPLKNLSYNIGERIGQLFEAQEKWNKTDLEIYLSDFLDPKHTIDMILIKYCQKVSSDDGGVSYTQKITILK